MTGITALREDIQLKLRTYADACVADVNQTARDYGGRAWRPYDDRHAAPSPGTVPFLSDAGLGCRARTLH